eukprot:352530-Chlamydomonas_euryale.AAC.2
MSQALKLAPSRYSEAPSFFSMGRSIVSVLRAGANAGAGTGVCVRVCVCAGAGASTGVCVCVCVCVGAGAGAGTGAGGGGRIEPAGVSTTLHPAHGLPCTPSDVCIPLQWGGGRKVAPRSNSDSSPTAGTWVAAWTRGSVGAGAATWTQGSVRAGNPGLGSVHLERAATW